MSMIINYSFILSQLGFLPLHAGVPSLLETSVLKLLLMTFFCYIWPYLYYYYTAAYTIAIFLKHMHQSPVEGE